MKKFNHHSVAINSQLRHEKKFVTDVISVERVKFVLMKKYPKDNNL